MSDTVFFILSKTLTWFIDPLNMFFVPFAVSMVLLFLNKIKWAKIFGALSVLIVFVIGALPLGAMMTDALENRFPVPKELPPENEIAGIIVLGGMVNPNISRFRGQVSLNDNAERITSLLEITKRYPNSTVLFTGGSGRLGQPELREAHYTLPLLQDLIRPTNKLIMEDQARNTYENAILTKQKIASDEKRPWLLVTSAFHMPRSVGVFRAQDIEIIPYPVDFKRARPASLKISRSPMSGFDSFKFAIHEWLGLFVYHFTDKSSATFPAPRP